jgi:hypothetical protein
MPSGSPSHRLTRVGGSPVVVVVAVAAVVAALAVAMDRWSYDVWGAFWVGPVLLGLTIPIANRIARQEGDPKVGRLILLAFGAKVLAGTVLRYIAVNGVYGSGDAKRYSTAGRILAPMFRRGVYENLGKVSATRFLEILTGQVFAVIGPTDLGAYLFFSWIAFLGLLLMVQAFRIAVPNGDHHRYRLLVLFFPSLLFWPSSIGKDAWLIFCLGIAAYGLARAFTGRLSGIVAVGLGLWGATVVRPHIALLVIIAGGAAMLVRTIAPRIHGEGGPHRLRSATLAIVLVVGVVAVMGQAQTFFNLDSLNPESAQGVLTEVNRRTGQGGSEFNAPSATTPTGYAQAFVTVLFRPFPLEGSGGLSLVTSAEGVLFAVVVAGSLGRLSRLPALAVRTPYVLFGLLYVLGFVYAFSSIENFGILARERAQLLPFAFILLCLPRKPKRERQRPLPLRGRAAEPAHLAPADQ